MRRLVAYTRVSTDQQSDNTSLPHQLRRIEGYCLFADCEIVQHFSDVETASGKKVRKGLDAALEHIYAGHADGLIVTALDRFSRSVKDGLRIMEDLADAKKQLVILDFNLDTSNPVGEAAFIILLAVSQLERKQIAARTKAGRQCKRDQGLYASGAPPYGWVPRDKTLVPDPFEQKWRRYIFERRTQGAGYKTIARELNNKGIPAKRGGKWHPIAIYRILKDDLKNPVQRNEDDDSRAS